MSRAIDRGDSAFQSMIGRSRSSESAVPRRRRIATFLALLLLTGIAALVFRIRAAGPDWVFPVELLLEADGDGWRLYDRSAGAELDLEVVRADPDGIVFRVAEPERFGVLAEAARMLGALTGRRDETYFAYGDKLVLDGRTFAVLLNGEEQLRRMEADILRTQKRLEESERLHSTR